MVTIVNNNVYLKFADRSQVFSPHTKKVAMWGDGCNYVTVYTYIKNHIYAIFIYLINKTRKSI